MMTRRQLLGTAASAPLLLGGVQSTKSKRVIVAGGGIAGLCCAYELKRAGHDVTVLEASNRVGGHVKTIRADLPDGLYVDGGAEQFTKPGYELYWQYVREFNLPHLQDHRRDDMLRWKDGRVYSEEQLSDPRVLANFGFNPQEVAYLKEHPWPSAGDFYLNRYAEAFPDEYQPFTKGTAKLDELTLNELLQKEGASDAFLRNFGSQGSALHVAWHAGILKQRKVPAWPTQVFRLIGGNSLLPETFAKHLGERVKLGSPVTAIRHSPNAVQVSYRKAGSETTMEGDYLVCCMSAVMLRQIPVTPDFDERKHWAIHNVPYYSATRPIFVTSSKFWHEQNTSINMEFGHGSLQHVWSMADEVGSPHGVITGTSDAGVGAQQALATFRARYPSKRDTIERALVVDWSKDPWCLACETTTYKPGELNKFWPSLIEPHGRIHFAGAYCDNLNWGQEAATRSAHRVARAIHEA